MIICFSCSSETKSDLDALLKAGQYRDYAEAISSAVKHELLLNTRIAAEGVVVFDDPTPTTMRRNSKLCKLDAPHSLIPDLFRPEGLVSTSPNDAVPLNETMPASGIVTLDKWILGQYNKLLPVKANCRALAHLMPEQAKGLPVKKTAFIIGKEAWGLGYYLRQLDERFGTERDEALATGFPYGGSGEETWTRYARQFVAYVSKQGNASGLLLELKLAFCITTDTEPKILLTRAGRQFAALPNPVLDGALENGSMRFYEAERDFLLSHISEFVPVENFAYKVILAAIEDGADTPDKLGESLTKFIPKDREKELTVSFCASQRSGVLSRMTDIGLVKRLRDGLHVKYTITDRGILYAKNKAVGANTKPNRRHAQGESP